MVHPIMHVHLDKGGNCCRLCFLYLRAGIAKKSGVPAVQSSLFWRRVFEWCCAVVGEWPRFQTSTSNPDTCDLRTKINLVVLAKNKFCVFCSLWAFPIVHFHPAVARFRPLFRQISNSFVVGGRRTCELAFKDSFSKRLFVCWRASVLRTTGCFVKISTTLNVVLTYSINWRPQVTASVKNKAVLSREM